MQRLSVFVMILSAGFLAGCATHPSLSGSGFVPPDPSNVSIEFEHGHAAMASLVLMEQPAARITLKDDATGRRVKLSHIQWNSEVEQLLTDQGLTLVDSPDGWTDYKTSVWGSGFDDIDEVEFQLHSVQPPLHWNEQTNALQDFVEFPLLESILCELSEEGSCTYSYEANTIIVRDRPDRIASIEELIAEEESYME